MAVSLESLAEFSKIVIDRSPPPPQDAGTQCRVDDAWEALLANNPRYFNAPILVYESYDARTGALRARVDQYKHHAVRESIDLGITLLAVTATICKPDRDRKAPVYLLGKRSEQSHMYGGLWEYGPSGGVEPPRFRRTISFKGLLGQVNREVREEVGFSVLKQPAAPVTLVHDTHAGSTDIHVGIVLADQLEPSPNWEYDDTRWVTLDELIKWSDEKPNELIPTTIAHARYLHEARA